MDITPAIATHELTKRFPPDRRGEAPVLAVDHLTMAVPRGAFYGLLGRNGQGKSTLMRLLLGLLHPSSGTAELLGFDFGKADPISRARVAYVPQRHQLQNGMSLREYCQVFTHFYAKWDQPYADALAMRFSLPPDRRIGALSGGQQRKVAIVLALACRAELLLLDEPAAGLDPVARHELIDELIEAMATAEGVTVLFSTHIISDLERLADHVGIMDQGRMILSESLDELRERIRQVQVICADEKQAIAIRIPGAIRVERTGRVINAVVEQPQVAEEALRQALPDAQIDTYPLGLEEIFVELVRSLDQPLAELQEVA